MPVIVDNPLINDKLNYHKPINYHYRNGLSYFCNPYRISIPQNYRRQKLGFSTTIPIDFRLSLIIRANNSCDESPNSTDSNDSKQGEQNANPKPARKKEKERKGRWFNGDDGGGERSGWFQWQWRWKWEPLIQAQKIGVLLLQLGFVMFVMRLIRPGMSLPVSGLKPATMFVSVPYSEFLNKVNCGLVKKVEVDGVHIMFRLKNEGGGGGGGIGVGESEVGVDFENSESLLKSVVPTKRIVYTTTRPVDIKTPYEKMIKNHVEFGSPDKQSGGFLNSALIALFYVAVVGGLLQRLPVSFSQHTAGQLRNSSKSGNSGSAKVTEQGETITFADVAGVDESKEELEEIVEFLRSPDRYLRLGARPPRGVLLVGLPGTGKTLLPKAVAGEAEVPFISCSASEFIELYVGMGASRVRDLFARAKKEAPSIIFIDEIDAVAKIRDGKSRIVSNDEREQTLNQLLTEMDGFDSNSAVIFPGATNPADVLDPALRRPGRFDRVVMVETPDKMGREAILKVHVSNKELPLKDDIDLSDIASMTTGFTGADLANLVNEAALLAGRQNKLLVEKVDFIQAVERSIARIEKKTAKLKGNEKAVVACHEAGHAVVGTAVANLLPGQPRVEKLSILPRSGGALGFTYTPPTTEDRYAAEEVAYKGCVSTGAVDDIRRATDMAYKAIAEYGLNQAVGPVSLAMLSSGGIDDSRGSLCGRDQGHLVDLVQKEVKSLLQSALDIALCVIHANPTVLEGLCAHLEEKEKVEGEELQEWLKSVVAPTELLVFIQGKKESFLPLQPLLE